MPAGDAAETRLSVLLLIIIVIMIIIISIIYMFITISICIIISIIIIVIIIVCIRTIVAVSPTPAPQQKVCMFLFLGGVALQSESLYAHLCVWRPENVCCKTGTARKLLERPLKVPSRRSKGTSETTYCVTRGVSSLGARPLNLFRMLALSRH